MANDIVKNLGDVGVSLLEHINSEIDRRVEQKLELYQIAFPSASAEEEYELSTKELAQFLKCGKDKILEYVHSGVLRGCFIKHGNYFQFKRLASKRAIEAHSQREIYGENENQPKTISASAAGSKPGRGTNVRTMPGRKTA